MTPPATLFRLDAYLAEEGARAEEALDRSLSGLAPLLPPDVMEVARYAVLGGGKRLRPILCAAAWRACGGGETEGIHDLGAAVELIHAYSLMHDDLPCMDDAPLRRGRPTPHRVFGVGRATVAGAALIPAAALTAWRAAGRLNADPSVPRQVVRELCRAAGGGGMVGGQVLDLLGEGRVLDEQALDGLHARKTGALLTASLRLGGVAAGASPDQLSALDGYGRAVGLAFQVRDDILDATAGVETLGKAPSDRDRGKSTYVALHGLPEAERRARELVDRALAELEAGGVDSPPLRALALHVVERDR